MESLQREITYTRFLLHGDTVQKTSKDYYINPLPHFKVLDTSRLKKFTDNQIFFKRNYLSVGKYKTSWEKEEMLVTIIFSIFPQCFQKDFLRLVSSWGCVVKGARLHIHQTCFQERNQVSLALVPILSIHQIHRNIILYINISMVVII